MDNDLSKVIKLQEGKIMTQTEFSFSMTQHWVKSTLKNPAQGKEGRAQAEGWNCCRLTQFLMNKTEEEPIGKNYRCPIKAVIVLVYLFINTVSKGILVIIKMYNL